ncbi:CsgG/HfaB family protein [Maricaulis maris]|jgi:holdfast attachment protein HfaB|uniref:CsgG/HfaB family protein n=1 Tax=Maricaulis maris TaxID=74318 RepID=UPI002926F729|nr:hypothetical protein MACH15_22640 [Maricaulis maris]
MRRFALPLIAALLLPACSTTQDPDAPVAYVAPLTGSPVVQSRSVYTEALHCLADHARSQNYAAPRLAVGHISDLTGAEDYLSGRRLTQGATLMAITAASEAGMRLVERFDMGVVQVELDYAQSGLVRDAPNVLRTVQRGQMEGADLYLVGGITEFNPNIRSSGTNAFANTTSQTGGALAFGGSEYIVDVGIDLRLIDVRSTEVLAVRSLRKQIRGQEVEAGVYAFLDGTVLDIGGGERALEPVQTAVRSMIDRAVFEFMAMLYDLESGSCIDGQPALARQQTAQIRPAPTATLVQEALPEQPQALASNARSEIPRNPIPPSRLPPTNGYGLHIASELTVWNVNREWRELRAIYADLLAGRAGRVLRVEQGHGGAEFHLLAGSWQTESEAVATCEAIRQRGGTCAVAPFDGQPVMRG